MTNQSKSFNQIYSNKSGAVLFFYDITNQNSEKLNFENICRIINETTEK